MQVSKALLWLSLALPLFATEHEISIEHSNFTLSKVPYGDSERVIYNYHRMRLTDTLKEGNWFATLIADIEHYYGQAYLKSNEYRIWNTAKADTPYETESNPYHYGNAALSGRIHRFNVGYTGVKQHAVLGLQKITMGVGRIWTPTDLFNPRDPLALEPDQIDGTFALSYTYALGTLSEIMGVTAKRKDGSYKYAGRIKSNVEVADIALDLFSSSDAKMIAYEIEGNLFDTGIEWRTEGGWFRDRILHREFYQTILGLDYGFQNGVTVASEWIHSSNTYTLSEILTHTNDTLSRNRFLSSDYLGATASYDFNLLINGSFSTIYNPKDQSFFTSPLLSYTISDDASVTVAAMLYGGADKSEFGALKNSYYFRIKIFY